MDLDESLKEYGRNPADFVRGQYELGHKIVVMGEKHNSSEHHGFICNLLRSLSRGNLKLGLELNMTWQKRVDKYIATRGASSDKYFEAGTRRGSGYGRILSAAAQVGIPVLCLDEGNLENKDEGMASRLCSRMCAPDEILVYVGGSHASSADHRTGGILKREFGDAKVFTVKQETEPSLYNPSSTYGFTAALSKSVFGNSSLAFSLKDKRLRAVLEQIDQGTSSVIWGKPWYDSHDGFIYLAKDLEKIAVSRK